MRLHRWFGPLCGALAVVASTNSVSAQQPPLPGSGSAYADPSGAFYQMPGPGAYPNNFQPWPAVSPYQMDYGRTMNEGGLWNYDNQSQAGMGSHWKFRTDYQHVAVKQASGYIGHTQAPTYKQQIRNTLTNQQQGGGGGGANANQLQTLLDRFEGTNNYGNGFNWFDPVIGGDTERAKLNGLRFSLDNLSPDGTGLEIYTHFASDKDAEFDSRVEDVHPRRGKFPEIVEAETLLQLINARAPQLLLNNNVGGSGYNLLTGIDLTQVPGPVGPAGQPTLYRNLSEALQANFLNLRGIPLDDGTLVTLPGGATIGGASAVYDLDFRIKFAVEQYGAGLRWQMMPLVKNNWIRVNPNAGLRFTSLEESFSFYGRHSGWSYGSLGAGAGGGGNNQNNNPEILFHSLPNFFDDNSDGIIDNAGLIEDQTTGQGGGGGNQAGTASFTPPTNAIYPITSVLRSRVNSYLAGPELGLSYEIGGDSLKIGGRSTFALLANHERMQLQGDNIFVTTRESNLIQPTAADPRPNDFSDSNNTTHVSPLFEQNFYVEGPFLRYIPVVRRANIFRNASVNVGYTLTFIGEVTRPDENIHWQGNPAAGLFPSILKNDRSTWKSDMLNIGITWKW